MATNAYATVAELAAFVGMTGSGDDLRLDRVLTAVSRDIEAHCDRKFWLDPLATPTVRQFAPRDWYLLDLGRHEIGAATPVTVEVDAAGDGTFETTLTAGQYQLEPVNAPVDLPEARPFSQLRAIGVTWPINYTPGGRAERVKITARFGWPAVPAAVSEACLVLAAELFKTKDTPYGVAGFSEFGVVRVRDNPKAARLLAPYLRVPVLVA